MTDVPPTVDTGETVRITVPADSAFVSVLRTVTAAMAARRDFTIEEIDDTRIAIDEACALLLPQVVDGSAATLTVVFGGTPERLEATATVTGTLPGVTLDRASFAWLVLSAVVDDVDSEQTGEDLTVRFSKLRSPRP